MGRKIVILCLVTLALGLFVTDTWLGFRRHRYSRLVAQHECGYSHNPVCRADFDGDGKFTQIKVLFRHDASVELPPRFNGTEDEAVLNAFFMDGTARTHVAIARESNRDRLIVYEGMKWPDTNGPVKAVYQHNGNQLVENTPTEVDQEILAALASRDDAGTHIRWVVYSLLAWPVRVVYLLPFVVAALLLRRDRRLKSP